MKFFKFSILALAAVATFGFTACSNDDQYNPGDPSDGVYFDGEGTLQISASPTETMFAVNVYRQGITGAATYKVDVTTENSELFDIPSSVSFAEGSNSAYFEIGYNAADLSSSETYTVELALDKDVPVCAYGSATVTLVINLQKALSEPIHLEQYFGAGGDDCTWYYETSLSAQVAGISVDPGLPISFRVNTEDTEEGQFWIEHWFGDTDLYIDFDNKTYDCHIPFGTSTGYIVNTQEYGQAEFMCTDAYTYLMEAPDPDNHDEELAKQFKDASWYDPETGVFSMYMIYYCGDGKQCSIYDMGYEHCQVSGFANYVPELTFAGTMVNADNSASYALVDYVVSEDVDELRLMAGKGMTANDIYNAILAGDSQVVTVTGTSGTARVQIDGSGSYTLVGVTFAENEAKEAVSLTFTTGNGLPENAELHWPIVGTATIIDGWILPAFAKGLGLSSYTAGFWEVDLRESDSNPGMYRLVNPWASEGIGTQPCPLYAVNNNKIATDIYIDATDPECVVIEAQYSGFTDAAGKPYFIANFAGSTAAAGLSKDQIKANKGNTVFNDGFIEVQPAYYGNSEDDVTKVQPDGRNVTKSTILLDITSSASKIVRKKNRVAPSKTFTSLKGIDSNCVLRVKK